MEGGHLARHDLTFWILNPSAHDWASYILSTNLLINTLSRCPHPH
jgi:hypothetical protein